jgi:hypothetical protein
MKVRTSTRKTAGAIAAGLVMAALGGMTNPSVAATGGTGHRSSIADGDRLATAYSQGFETRPGAAYASEFLDETMVVPTSTPGFSVITTSYGVADWADGYSTSRYPGVGTRAFMLDKSENDYPNTGDYKATLQFVDFTDVALRITDSTNPVIHIDIYNPTGVAAPVQAILTPSAGPDIYLCRTLPAGWSSASFDFSSNGSWSSSTSYTKFAITVDNGADCSTPLTSTGIFGIWSFDNLAFNGYQVLAVTGAAHTAGTAKVKKVLNAGNVAATGTGAAVSYQWYACKSAASATTTLAKAKCSAIAGAIHKTFTLAKAQKGKYVRVVVTAHNTGATMTYLTKSTSKVK